MQRSARWRRFRYAPALAAAALAAGFAVWGRTPHLTVGTDADFPPFASREDGEIDGFDMEIARAIAEKAGLELKIVAMEFGDLLPALERGSVDLVLAALAPTEERRGTVDFSAPYYRATPVALIRKGEPAPASKQDLRGRRIGAQLGTTGAAAAEELTAEADIRRANSPLGAVVDLMNGRVDAVILDEQPAIRFAQKSPDLRWVPLGFDEEAYGVAVRRGNAALLETVNQTLAEMVADGRYDRILDRWMVRMAVDEE